MERESIIINTIETIEPMMATTITIKEATKARLDDYKVGNTTYDELLNEFMDEVSLEDTLQNHIEEHNRRLANWEGIPAKEFIQQVKRERGL